MSYANERRSLVVAVAILLIALLGMGIALAAEADGAEGDPEASGTETSTSEGSEGGVETPAVTRTAQIYIVGAAQYSIGQYAEGDPIALPTLAELGTAVPAGKEFGGWSDGTAAYPAGTARLYSADVTYTAVITAIQYTVDFKDGDETEQTSTVEYGQTVEVPADPSRLHYAFAGWSIDGKAAGIKAGDRLEVTADATYTATYAPAYTYAVIVDGTTIAKGDTTTYIEVSDPSKVGYRFVAWSDGASQYTDLGAAVKAQSADATYVAVWEPMTYTVAFVADGQGILTETIKHGDRAIEPAVQPSKEGYDFRGWSIDGATAYDFASPVTEDLVLTALYTAVVVPDAPATVTYIVDGITVYDPATPSKEGYEFAGWADGQTIVKADDLAAYIAALPAGASVTLTATWTPLVYTVAFVADGVTILTQSVKYGELATEPAVQPAKAGYDFAGWDFDFATPVKSDLTVEAVYRATETPAAPVDATYIVDGLTVKGADTPSKVGYRFVGWSDGSSVITDVSAYLAGLEAGSSVTLTAVFEPIVYTVTFVSDGETVLTQSVKYGELATVPAAKPTNMDFDHWDYDFAVPITKDTTINAVAVVVVYHDVTFDYGYPGVQSVVVSVADGGTVAELPVIYPYMGDVEWSITTGTPITADTTATLQAVAPVDPEPVAPTEDEDSSVMVELLAVVVIIAALAIAGIVCVKQGVPAKLKARKAARANAKAEKVEAGKEQPKP